MTTNQIDYYNARMKARNDRLSRKETKRHNKVMEGAQLQSSAASVASAQAAQSQAATAAKRYQLEWETEYGFPYGTSQEEMNDRSNWTSLETREDKGYNLYPNRVTPQSYATKQFQIMKDVEGAKTEQSKRYLNYSNAVQNITKGASNTYKIVKEIVD